MDWSFGLSSNEIEMTALGFAVQHKFFDDIVNGDAFLGDMTLAFGLVGFAIILLTLGRMPVLQIFTWAALFLILIVRPVLDTAFFVDLNENNAPQLYQGPAMGGQLTQEEYAAIVGESPDGQTFSQRLTDRGYPSITAFTPQIAAISALNKMNAGLSNQFLAPGHRTLEGFQPAIEAIKRGRLASDSSNFHLGQFLSICAADDAGAAQRLAATYIPFTQLEEQGSDDIIEALKDKKISGWDAWVLFNQYDGYAQRQGASSNASLTLPPLVCPADGCGGEGEYTVTDTELVEEVLRPITVTAAEDFTRIRDTRRQVLFDTHAMTALLSDNVEGIERRMREQKLSMAVPLNANSIAANMSFESAEDGASTGFDLAPYIEAAAQGLAGSLGCAAGAAVIGTGSVAVAGGVTAVTGGLGAPVGAVIIGAGVVLGCAGGAISAAFLADAAIPETFQVNLGVGDARNVHPEKVFVVETCADFHRLTDARLYVDTAIANRLTETIAEVMQSGNLPDDFSQMSAEEQAMVALQSALAAQTARCNRGTGQSSRNNRPCSEQAAQNMGELIAFAQMAAANNTLPGIMASIHAENATSVRQIGAVRQAMAFGGEMFALPGVELKAIWGGFEAGTYAKIMPFIVAFGTAITVMITPFLYMIGLLVPQWSLSILLIPIVGVVYFQMVKVVFTVINILGATFLDAHELGLLQGTDAAFADIIMGTAYTMAFMLSAGLLFALKNPGAIIQNVAGKADGISQISWQEAAATAYLGQKAIGMAGGAISGKTWGGLAGGAQNALSGRGGWQDQFKAAEFETTQQGDGMRMTAEQARLTPRESDETIGYRAQAKAMDGISARADEADKGSMMEGFLRKGRSVSYRDTQGNLRNMTLDSAPVALAEAAGKNAPDIAKNRDIARKMLNQKVAVMVDHSDGSRYVQIDMEKVQSSRDTAVHNFVKKLETKGALTSVQDGDKTLTHVLKDKL